MPRIYIIIDIVYKHFVEFDFASREKYISVFRHIRENLFFGFLHAVLEHQYLTFLKHIKN